MTNGPDHNDPIDHRPVAPRPALSGEDPLTIDPHDTGAGWVRHVLHARAIETLSQAKHFMLVGQGGGWVFFSLWSRVIVLSNVRGKENPATLATALDGRSIP